jgi:quinol monooxygenase YgiN
MSETVVVARARARAGKESDLEAALLEAIPPTHAEPGCSKYALHRCVEDPASFVLIERWSSKEALGEHLSAPHIQKLFAKLPDLVDGAPEIRVYKPIAAGRPDKGKI